MTAGQRFRANQVPPGDHARGGWSGGERGTGLASLRDRQPQSEPLGNRHGLGDVDGNDRVHAHLGREPVDGAGDLVPDDREPGAVVGELVAEFAIGVQRVVFDHDRTEPQYRIERDHVLRAIGHHQRDPVAVPDPEGAQSTRRAPDQLAQLPVRRR